MYVASGYLILVNINHIMLGNKFVFSSTVPVSIVLSLVSKTPWAVIVTSAERRTSPLEVKASTTYFGRVNWEMARWRKIASDAAKGLCSWNCWFQMFPTLIDKANLIVTLMKQNV